MNDPTTADERGRGMTEEEEARYRKAHAHCPPTCTEAGVIRTLDQARRERDEARVALESVEWSEFNDGCCPACGAAPIEDHGTGHAPDCVIRKALRGGGS